MQQHERYARDELCTADIAPSAGESVVKLSAHTSVYTSLFIKDVPVKNCTMLYDSIAIITIQYDAPLSFAWQARPSDQKDTVENCTTIIALLCIDKKNALIDVRFHVTKGAFL